MYNRIPVTRTLKGNDKKFELARNSSYRGKFQWNCDQGKGIKFSSNYRGIPVIRIRVTEVLPYSTFSESHTCWQIEVRSYNLITSLPVAAINRTQGLQRKLPKVKLPISDHPKCKDFVVVYDNRCIGTKSTPKIIHCIQFLGFNTNSAMLSLKVAPTFPKKTELLQSQLKAMLSVLPPTFKPVNKLICCKTGLMWFVKRSTSLFNSLCSNVAPFSVQKIRPTVKCLLAGGLKLSTQKWSQSLLSQMWPSTGHSNDNGVLNKGSLMRGSHSSNVVGHLG